ncbi:MAG: hypothetical protein ACRCTB_05130 [Vibrio sp.]
MIEESGCELSRVVTQSHNSAQTLTQLANELEQWAGHFSVTR